MGIKSMGEQSWVCIHVIDIMCTCALFRFRSDISTILYIFPASILLIVEYHIKYEICLGEDNYTYTFTHTHF